MTEFIDKIIFKDFTAAEQSLKEGLAQLVERKLGEKKKMMAASEKKEKTILVTTKGDPKAKSGGGVQRIPASKYNEKVHNLAVEAVVHKDGLVHLATGENVLPSVYKQRRWLTEGADNVSPADDWHENFQGRLEDAEKNLKNDYNNPIRAAIAMRLKKARKAMKNDPEGAEDHLHHAKKLHRQSHGKHVKEEGENSSWDWSSYGKKLKEDCGLAPDKEALLHAALDKARLLIEPKLDTTAPRVDRTKLCIPKGVRPADRLSAPDLGPKEDEWMHGKKLEEDQLSESKRFEVGDRVMFKSEGMEQSGKIHEFKKIGMNPHFQQRYAVVKVWNSMTGKHEHHNVHPSDLTHENEEHLDEEFEMGKVHHLEFGDGERSYFIPKEKLKNGRYSGTIFDEGAAGRSRKKPKTGSADPRGDWQQTPEDEIPSHIKNHLNEKQLDEERKRTQKERESLIRRGMAHNPEAAESIIKFGKEQRMFDSAKKEIKKLKAKSLEEEQLDEISKKTLKSYVSKAEPEKKERYKEYFWYKNAKQHEVGDEPISKFKQEFKDARRKFQNRSKGLARAYERLDEERKRTQKVADAFMMKKSAKERTLTTDGKEVKYHGNVIAKHDEENSEVHVSAAGWGHSPSTRGHINGILDRLNSPRLHVKKGQLYHGDTPVGSRDWIKVKR